MLYRWKRKVAVKPKGGKKYYSISLPPRWVEDKVDPQSREVEIVLLENGCLLIRPVEKKLIEEVEND